MSNAFSLWKTLWKMWNVSPSGKTLKIIMSIPKKKVGVPRKNILNLAGPYVKIKSLCGCSLVVEHQLPKLRVWVRFPSSAPSKNRIRPPFLGSLVRFYFSFINIKKRKNTQKNGDMQVKMQVKKRALTARSL